MAAVAGRPLGKNGERISGGLHHADNRSDRLHSLGGATVYESVSEILYEQVYREHSFYLAFCEKRGAEKRGKRYQLEDADMVGHQEQRTAPAEPAAQLEPNAEQLRERQCKNTELQHAEATPEKGDRKRRQRLKNAP
jgi:hypothetical protein